MSREQENEQSRTGPEPDGNDRGFDPASAASDDISGHADAVMEHLRAADEALAPLLAGFRRLQDAQESDRATIDRLTAELTQRSGDAERYNNRLGELERRAADLQSELEGAVAERAAMEMTIHDLQREVDERTAHAGELSRRAGELSLHADQLQQETAEHAAARERLEIQLVTLQERANVEEQKAAAAEAAAADSSADARQERARADELTQHVDELEARASDLERQADQAKTRLAESEEARSELQHRMEDAERRADELTGQVREATIRASEAEDRLVQALRAHQEEIAVTRANVEQGRHGLEEVEADRRRLEEELTAERRRAEEMLAEHRRASETHSTSEQGLRAEIEVLQSRIRDLEAKAVDVQSAKAAAAAQVEAAQQEHARLQATLDEVVVAKEDLSRLVHERDQRLRDVSARLAAATGAAEAAADLAAAHAAGHEERDRLVAEVETHRTAAERLESEVGRLAGALDAERQRVATLESTLAAEAVGDPSAAASERDELLGRVEEQSVRISDLEREIANADTGPGPADADLHSQLAELQSRLEQSEIRARHAYSAAENAEAELRVIRENAGVAMDPNALLVRERDELRDALAAAERRIAELKAPVGSSPGRSNRGVD